MRFLLKILISALIVAGASELSKRSTLFGAILISLPLSSILAFTWVYLDSGDTSKVATLSMQVFWAILPSLLFFPLLANVVKRGLGFGVSMLISCAGMAVAYLLYAAVMKKLGVDLG